MMKSIVIEERFCGPPFSANGGYVCGLLSAYIQGSAEIKLVAPVPLGQPLEIVSSERGVDLRNEQKILATGRAAELDTVEPPVIGFVEAEQACRCPPDANKHPFPTCFVCGPARVEGDGLRIIPGPLASHPPGTVAAPWVPHSNLARDDDYVPSEIVWAALDCPTGFAAVKARHLGMGGSEIVLLGTMRARIERRPRPDEQCAVVAWPTGRDNRKIFASSALLGSDGKALAVAQATWLLMDPKI